MSVKQAVKEEEQSIKAYAASMASIDKVLAESQSMVTSEERGIDDASQWQAMPLHGAYHPQIAEASDLRHTHG